MILQLRGGGACVSRPQQFVEIVTNDAPQQLEEIQIAQETQHEAEEQMEQQYSDDTKKIEQVFHPLLDLSNSIQQKITLFGTYEGKNFIYSKVAQVQENEDVFYEFMQDQQVLTNNHEFNFQCLNILLDATNKLIRSDKFITLQILKICNYLSRSIFSYYIGSKDKCDQDQIEELKQIIIIIEQYLNDNGESQTYFNGIYYEIQIIKFCLETIPLIQNYEQQLLISTCKSALMSIFTLSFGQDLKDNLMEGIKYLFLKAQEKEKKYIFSLCLQIEQMRWIIQKQIQTHTNFYHIFNLINDIYQNAILKITDWMIQYSWIKAMSDLLILKPTITFMIFKQNYREIENPEEVWKQLLNQGVIKVINQNKQLAIIQTSLIEEPIINQLQEQLLKYEMLQDNIMNGFQYVPSFIDYYDNILGNNKIKKQDNETIGMVEFLNKIQSINYQGILQFLNHFSLRIQEFLQYYMDIYLEMKNEQNDKSSIIFNNQISNCSFKMSYLIMQIQKYLAYQEFSFYTINSLKPIFQSKQKLDHLLKFYTADYMLNYLIDIEKIIGSNHEISERVFQTLESELIENSETSASFQILINYFQNNNIDFKGNSISTLKFTLQKFPTLEWLDRIAFLIQNFNYLIPNESQCDVLVGKLIQQITIINKLRIEININQQNFIESDVVNEFRNNFYEFIEVFIKFKTKLSLLEKRYTDIKQEINQNLQISNFRQLQQQNTLQQFDPHLSSNDFIHIYITKIIKQTSYIIKKINIEKNTFQDVMLQQQKNKFHMIQYSQLIDKQINENVKQLLFVIGQVENFEKWMHSIDKKRNKILQSQPNTQNIEIIQKLYQSFKNEQYKENINQNIQNQLNYFQILDDYITQLNKEIKSCVTNEEKRLINEMHSFNQFIKFIINQNYEFVNNDKQKLILESVEIKKEALCKTLEKWLEQDHSRILEKKKSSLRFSDIVIDYSNEQLQKEIQNCKANIINSQLQQQIENKIKSIQITSGLLEQLNNSEELKENKNQMQKILMQELTELQENYNQWVQKINIVQENIIKLLKLVGSVLLQHKDAIKQNEDIFKEISFLFSKNETQDLNIININTKQKIFNYLIDFQLQNQWRVKECFVFHSIIIQTQLTQKNCDTICQQLLLISAKETDFRVKITLKNKDNIQQMSQIFSKFWNQVEKQIQDELNTLLNKIQAIQFHIQGAENETIRNQLYREHKELEEQVEQILNNVEEIGDILKITISFLKDIRKDLQKIQKQLNKVIEKIDEIGQDIKFLRGKTPRQLLELRMEQILTSAILNDAKSIYVQLKTKELGEVQEQDITPLFNNEQENNGEVNEFIDLDIKDSMLIHGPAGSGKSVAARKIEEFLWREYKENIKKYQWNDKQEIIPVIPIFIQLPSLKDPKQNAVEETLMSFQYNFDQKQVNEFKEIVMKGFIKLVFILDSYDELSKQYQGWNLIISNRLKLWKNEMEITQYPKIITTSRSDAFVTQNYREWFCADEPFIPNKFKEVKIEIFDETQRTDFLNQSSKLQIKMILMELYELLGKKMQRTIDISIIVDPTWQIIEKNFLLTQKDDHQLLNENEADQIIQIIKKDENLIDVNQEQETHLKKQLLSVWSKKQYEQCIKSMELQKFLETPFMMNIVIQVLPTLFQKVSQPEFIKESFQKNFQRISEYEYDRINKIQYGYDNKINQKVNNIDFSNKSIMIWSNLIYNKFFNYFNASHNLDDTIRLLKQHFQSAKFEIEENEITTVARALKSYSLEAIDFYQEFFELYAEKQIKKLQFTDDKIDYEIFKQDVQFYATQLATSFMINQETGVEYKQTGLINQTKILKDAYFSFFDLNDKLSKYKGKLRKCIPLKQKGNYISFNHKSIQEFLMAHETLDLFTKSRNILTEIYNQIKQLPSNITEYNTKNILDSLLKPLIDNVFDDIEEQNQKLNKIKKKILNDYILIEHKRIFNIVFNQLQSLLQLIYSSAINQVIWSDTFYLGSIRFMMKKIENHHSLIEQLCFFVCLSRYSNLYINASSNSLQLLAFSQEMIVLRDFSKIQIKDVQLTGLKCINCKFKRTKFSNINFQGVNINFCNLGQCKWTDITTSESKNLDHRDEVLDLAISPKGDIIATSADKRIQTWNSLTGKLIEKSARGNHNYLRISFSPDGQQIVTSNRRGIIHFWIVATCKKIKERKIYAHTGFIYNVLYQPSGKQIATCGENSIKIWQVETSELIDTLNQQYKYCAIVYHPFDGNLIFADKDGNIKIWNKEILQFYTFKDKVQIKDLLFSPDGYQLSVACEDKNLRIFDYQNQSIIAELLHGGSVTCMYYSIDGSLIVTGSSDYNIRIWDCKTLKQKGEALIGHNDEITAVAISRDMKTIISGSLDKTARIWAIQSGKKITNQLQGHEGQVLCALYSPDGKTIISGDSTGSLKLWDAETGKESQLIFEGHDNSIISITFNRDGSIIASASEDKTIKLWNVITGKQINKNINIDGNLPLISFFNNINTLVCITTNKNEQKIQINIFDIDKYEFIKQENIQYYESYTQDIIQNKKDNIIYYFNQIQLITIIGQKINVGFDYIFSQKSLIGSCIDISDNFSVICNQDRKIILYNNNQFNEILKQNEIGNIWSCKFSPNEEHIITAHMDNYIQVLDRFTLKIQQQIPQLHKNRITSLCYSPNGKNFVSSSNDKTIRIWNNENIKLKKKYDRLSLEEILQIKKQNIKIEKGQKKQQQLLLLNQKTGGLDIQQSNQKQLKTSENKMYYQQFCISKIPMSIQFQKVKHKNSDIKSKTNIDLIKEWKSI